MDVGSLMKKPAVSVTLTETLASVVRKMRAAGVSAVVVVGVAGLAGVSAVVVVGVAGLAGILTERDVMRAVADGLDTTLTRAEAYMTPRPQTVPPDEPATGAAALMLSLGTRHLPVVEKGEVLGVISARDLLRLGESSRRLAELSSEPW
jgi:CBS domain-containing protein